MRKTGALAVATTVLGAMLSAHSAVAQTEVAPVWDPFESFNKAVYSFNEAFSSAASGPLVEAYRYTVPAGVRTSVDNFFTNLREPLTALSSALQGDMSNAGVSLGRFAINSTAGIGGLFEVATDLDWRSRPQDLGVTMCSYGIPAGPYVVLPFIGAATIRETAGILATYSLVYNMSHDWGSGAIVLDRAASIANDRPLPDAVAPLAPRTYEEQRDAYVAFRTQLCNGSVAKQDLKASPLGSIMPVSQ